MNTPEIEELMRIVEDRFGKCLNSTSDFDEFSLMLEKRKYGRISSSTLKRLWGYVGYSHKPRLNTLDILSTYIGYASFDKFREWLKSSSLYNSSYFSAEHISSSDLVPGSGLEIGWSPNRIIRLRYMGDSEFTVIAAENSKLKPGDRFACGCFIKGQPLCLPYIVRNGEMTAAFIAGRNGGLTHLKISAHE